MAKKKEADISKRTVILMIAIFVAISVIGTISVMDMGPANFFEDSATVFGKVSIVVSDLQENVGSPEGESKVKIVVN